MSEIKVNSIKGVGASTAAITVNNTDGTCTANITNNLSNRNAIVNGACEVAQRGVSSTSADFGSVDRMKMSVTGTDQLAFAQKQTSDAPDGFSKCFEFDVTTAESALDAEELVYMRYAVESQDLIPFFNANGTGKNFILSFYVKAYQAGTYQVGIYKEDSTRFITKTYTVASSATWQRIEIPITGDTSTSGMTFDNTIGFQLSFIFAAGTNYTSGSAITSWGSWGGNPSFAAGQSVNVLSSTDNYFRITGIQLELDQGSGKATDFEHRSFAQEIALCGRYYQNLIAANTKALGIGMAYNGATMQIVLEYPLGKMRTAPSIDAVTGADYWQIEGGGLSPEKHIDGSFVAEQSTDTQMSFYGVPDSNFSTVGLSHYVRSDNSACRFSFLAEL